MVCAYFSIQHYILSKSAFLLPYMATYSKGTKKMDNGQKLSTPAFVELQVPRGNTRTLIAIAITLKGREMM